MTTISAREFNQDVGAAKRAAQSGPVIVTDRGRASFVLLNISEYRRLSRSSGRDVVEALRMDDDFDFDIPPMQFTPTVPEL